MVYKSVLCGLGVLKSDKSNTTLNGNIVKRFDVLEDDDRRFMIQEVYAELRGKLMDEAFSKDQDERIAELQARITALITRL